MKTDKKIIDSYFIDDVNQEIRDIGLGFEYQEKELTNAKRLTKDLETAARQMTIHEARFLVDHYDIMQRNRIRASAQINSMSEEPHCVIRHFQENSIVLEAQICKALGLFAKNHPVGKWIMSMHGMGPVMSSRILAYIDIAECPTAGHIFSYAGLDPQRKWYKNEKEASEIVDRIVGDDKEVTYEHLVKIHNETGWSITHLDKFSYASAWVRAKEGQPKKEKTKKEKRSAACLKKAIMVRPHNAKLKNLCWNIGESFFKQRSKDGSYYGKILDARLLYEIEKNENGEYKEEAAKSLAKLKDKSTPTYKANIEGKLPVGHILMRCKRYAVKRFLSHLHYVWYKHEFQEDPPKPYVITHMGHTHIDYPPNLEIMNFDNDKILKNNGTIKAIVDKVSAEIEDDNDLVREARIKNIYKEVLKSMKSKLNP